MQCPACASTNISDFFYKDKVPTLQNVRYTDKQSAMQCKCGELDLKVCQDCGMIHNFAFKSELVTYDTSYENSQFESDIYKVYIKDLIALLRDRFQINQTKIIEIGCGNGKFLSQLIKATDSSGIGYDPSFKESLNGGGAEKIQHQSTNQEPNTSNHKSQTKSNLMSSSPNLTIKPKLYDASEKQCDIGLVACRHVIEHIQNPHIMLEGIYKSLESSPNALVFFETPRLEWILENDAFYDFFYEHCNYFTKSSLNALFSRSGFEVLEIVESFQGQYQFIFAKPREKALYKDFLDSSVKSKDTLSHTLKSYKNVAIWGAGAKGVTIANEYDNICCAIDINPNKQNCFIPKSGLEILSPKQAFERYKIDYVLVMNPNYLDEITSTLQGYNVKIGSL